MSEKLTKEDLDLLDTIDAKIVKGALTLAVLKMVKDGYCHGYEMIKLIKREECKPISTTLVYNHLGELEERGYIKGHWEQAEGPHHKKTFELTKKGEVMLEEAAKRFTVIAERLSDFSAQ